MIPDPADVIQKVGQSKFLLKLPHVIPETADHHRANALRLEEVVNNLPLASQQRNTAPATLRHSGAIIVGTNDGIPGPDDGFPLPFGEPSQTISLSASAIAGPGSLTLTIGDYGLATAAYLIVDGGGSLVFPLRPGASSSVVTNAFPCTGPTMTISIVWEAPLAGGAQWDLDYDYTVLVP